MHCQNSRKWDDEQNALYRTGEGLRIGKFTFFFTNAIKLGKRKSVSCEITDHPGLSYFCSPRALDSLRKVKIEKRMRRYLAQHVFPVSSSFLSSIVEDNLAKADCMSTSFGEGRHRDYHRYIWSFTSSLTVCSAEGQSLSCCYTEGGCVIACTFFHQSLTLSIRNHLHTTTYTCRDSQTSPYWYCDSQLSQSGVMVAELRLEGSGSDGRGNYPDQWAWRWGHALLSSPG